MSPEQEHTRRLSPLGSPEPLQLRGRVRWAVRVLAALTAGALAALVVVPATGGNGDDVDHQATDIAAFLERPLEWLDDAAQEASPRDKSSMVALPVTVTALRLGRMLVRPDGAVRADYSTNGDTSITPSVSNAAGAPARTLAGLAVRLDSHSPTWDGFGAAGRPLPGRTYDFQVTGRDPTNNPTSQAAQVTLDGSPAGRQLSPKRMPPGSARSVQFHASQTTRRWPGRRITYYSTLPARNYGKGFQAAVKEWNERGLAIKFVPARNRHSADFVVSVNHNISGGGYATIGNTAGRGQGFVWLSMKGEQWWDTALVASHELGHVLGLNHSRGCSLMSYSAFSDCKGPKNNWHYRCRLQERSDLVKVGRLYNSRFRARKEPFCLKHEATGAVTNLSATASSTSPTVIATLSWGKVQNAKSYLVGRSGPGGACLTKPGDDVQESSKTTFIDDTPERAAGIYCYTVWSLNVDGYPNPKTRKTVIYTYAPLLLTPVMITGQAGAWRREGFEWYYAVTIRWSRPSSADIMVLVTQRNAGCAPSANDPAGDSTYYGLDQTSHSASYYEGFDIAAGDTLCFSVFYQLGGWYSAPANAVLTVPAHG